MVLVHRPSSRVGGAVIRPAGSANAELKEGALYTIVAIAIESLDFIICFLSKVIRSHSTAFTFIVRKLLSRGTFCVETELLVSPEIPKIQDLRGMLADQASSKGDTLSHQGAQFRGRHEFGF